jgi:uncharacterized protein
MSHRFIAAVTAALAVTGLLLSGTAHAAGKKKLLIVSHTTGFRHSSIPTAEKTLAEIADKSGDYTVEYCRTGDDVKKMLTPEWLKANKIDGVFFANTTGNLGIPDLDAFLGWIKAGHAFLGAHSAGDTYHPQDAGGNTGYVDMIGCEFRTHGAQAEAECIVEDPKHPAVAHLAPVYTVKDEIYHYRENTRPKVHMLLALKTQPQDGVKDVPGTGSGQPRDMQISWCKMYGKGRVFYTALGHREDVWESEPYRQHILGAIRWAFGLRKGSAKLPATK